MPITKYLDQVAHQLQVHLGKKLMGLYVYGSWTWGDFQREESDLDLIAVCSGALHKKTKKQLAQALSHTVLPSPAAGTELWLVQSKVVRNPSPYPSFELMIRTGETWLETVEYGGMDTDLLIDLSICQFTGKAVVGRMITEAFVPIPHPWLKRALRNSLQWRIDHLMHPFHDPDGENAILNACRAKRYMEEHRFCSKTEAGRWAMKHMNHPALIKKALDIRQGKQRGSLQPSEVRSFVNQVKISLGATIWDRWLHWYQQRFK